MAYEALYTRARPKNLAQLVGQEHISNSLARAINQDRLSHAYLLVGTRGTGKTSTARILARAINCDTVHKAKENHQNLPNKSIPCNECESCKTFKSSPDNIEFDAASNRSVEDVSRLLSTAYLAPLQSRFKTFIIDEVHMLSFEAVNSILKLIEEPPPNVIFFLATTEFNKVPQTIRSRCQILNFKLIPQDVIVNHIINLAKNLNFAIEENAVKKIARLAKGSMRDALTFFDQCYSMTDSDLLTVDIVDNTLGLVSDSDLDEIIVAAKSKDRRKIINSTATAFKSGLTANIIVESIITRLRDIVSQINDSKSAELAFYNEMIDQLRKSAIEMQGSGIPEVILETALFKFASTPIVAPVYEHVANYEMTDSTSVVETAPENKDKVVDIRNFRNDPKHNKKLEKDVEEIIEADEEYNFDSEYGDDYIPEGFESDLAEISTTNFESENPVEKSETQIADENQLKVGEKIYDSIKDFLKTKENSDTVLTCMDFVKIKDFNSDILFVKCENPTMAFMFKEQIPIIEAAAKEVLHREIKIKFSTDNEDSTEKILSTDDKTFFGVNMSDEDRDYLFSVMKLLNVNKNEVKLLNEYDNQD